jgi:hypothetical protein
LTVYITKSLAALQAFFVFFGPIENIYLFPIGGCAYGSTFKKVLAITGVLSAVFTRNLGLFMTSRTWHFQ